MPEWLQQSWASDLEISPWALALRLAMAFVFGCAIAGIYRLTRREHVVAPTFPPTLVLLAILIAMVTHVIGDHVARAFSLVGALSIVRFRTVVEDTHDIAFVIFSVVVGMAVGANHLAVALIGTAIVGVAAFMVQPRRSSAAWSNGEAMLSVRLGLGRNPDMVMQTVFGEFLDRSDLVSGATGRQGAALDLTYKVRLRPGCVPSELIENLNRLEGVQDVELRRL